MSSALAVTWSAIYRPEWVASPEEYVQAGLVAWGRSRRLARADDVTVALKAYLGVQHFDPSMWSLPGEPIAKYFLSVIVAGRSIWLRTFPTVPDAWAALTEFHARLRPSEGN